MNEWIVNAVWILSTMNTFACEQSVFFLKILQEDLDPSFWNKISSLHNQIAFDSKSSNKWITMFRYNTINCWQKQNTTCVIAHNNYEKYAKRRVLKHIKCWQPKNASSKQSCDSNEHAWLNRDVCLIQVLCCPFMTGLWQPCCWMIERKSFCSWPEAMQYSKDFLWLEERQSWWSWR